MIMGECPYCAEEMWNSIADGELPKFQKLKCEACGKTIWLYHSRMNPEAMTEDAFSQRWEVNEETKMITRRPVPS